MLLKKMAGDPVSRKEEYAGGGLCCLFWVSGAPSRGLAVTPLSHRIIDVPVGAVTEGWVAKSSSPIQADVLCGPVSVLCLLMAIGANLISFVAVFLQGGPACDSLALWHVEGTAGAEDT